MLRYILVRVVWIFIMLWAILTTTFLFLKLAPSDPPLSDDTQRGIWLNNQVLNGFMTKTETFVVSLNDLNQINDYYKKFPDQKINQKVPKYVTSSNIPVGNPKKKIYTNETKEPVTTKINLLVNGKVVEKEIRVKRIDTFFAVPVITQYFSWIRNIVTKWNWGESITLRLNVSAFSIISERMGTTLKINVLALLIYLPIGFTIGVIAALKKNKFTDNVIQFGIMIFISVPSLILIMFLLIYFGYDWELLPTQFPTSDSSNWTKVKGYVIPVVALALPAVAGLSRLTRAELGEVLTSDFVLLARTKGLSHRQAVIRHSIRNSFVPLVPSVIASFAGLLGGSIVVERVYSIPGTGLITLEAIQNGAFDYNVVLVSTAFYTFIGLITTLIVDLSYGIVDPRIRMGAVK